VLLKPPALRRAPEVALVAGVAVAEALEAATGLRLGIKWPNDVLLHGEKLAGILAEARDAVVVLGFGINVNQTAAEVPAGATSLALATGREWARDALLAAVLAALERRYRGWIGGGLTAVREELAARDVLSGRPLRLDGREGVGAGIDGSGRLLVDVVGGERLAVESGVVELSR
jgi:BirA family biotin operon repressor/biotin-[acetyl-CoA-carboxylase] ligase